MTDYESSRWADREFSGGYAQNADNIIFERGRLIDVLCSFYGHYLGGRETVRLMDLGCGDGTLTRRLAGEFGNFVPTLVDGSGDMIDKARRQLNEVMGASFVTASFQDLLLGRPVLAAFDFIFSSLAIHHLETDEKKRLYKFIYDHLDEGGSFVNIDVVLPPSDTLERWYLGIWSDWAEKRRQLISMKDGLPDFSIQYKQNPDNKPDTLASQLEMLGEAGFSDVDCYYKYGIFSVFGGSRRHGPEPAGV